MAIWTGRMPAVIRRRVIAGGGIAPAIVLLERDTPASGPKWRAHFTIEALKVLRAPRPLSTQSLAGADAMSP